MPNVSPLRQGLMNAAKPLRRIEIQEQSQQPASLVVREETI
jgi:hypothetical protein